MSASRVSHPTTKYDKDNIRQIKKKRQGNRDTERYREPLERDTGDEHQATLNLHQATK